MDHINIGQYILGLERQHICGCGKGYLSYAALQQHVKIKHEGVFPRNSKSLNRTITGEKKLFPMPNFWQEFRQVFPEIEISQGSVSQPDIQQVFALLQERKMAYVASFQREFFKIQGERSASSSSSHHFKPPQNIYQTFSLFLLEIKTCSTVALF